eukprot:COSAG01_NODE_1398_length_10466_cov_173.518086_1_plen_252_part_00
MGKGGGNIGSMINQFILPLMYAALTAVFFSSFLFLIVGGYFAMGQDDDQKATGLAMFLFVVGNGLMYIAALGLIGLLRRSWRVLMLVDLMLIAVLLALLGLMAVCFILGFEIPSIEDVVIEGWQKGCPNGAADSSGCLQADLAHNSWCWENVPNPAICEEQGQPGVVSPESQKTHHCTVACREEWISYTRTHMDKVAIACAAAFWVLLIVVMWNSQTHHGLWCCLVSDNEDDTDSTVMSIPPGAHATCRAC